MSRNERPAWPRYFHSGLPLTLLAGLAGGLLGAWIDKGPDPERFFPWACVIAGAALGAVLGLLSDRLPVAGTRPACYHSVRVWYFRLCFLAFLCYSPWIFFGLYQLTDTRNQALHYLVGVGLCFPAVGLFLVWKILARTRRLADLRAWAKQAGFEFREAGTLDEPGQIWPVPFLAGPGRRCCLLAEMTAAGLPDTVRVEEVLVGPASAGGVVQGLLGGLVVGKGDDLARQQTSYQTILAMQCGPVDSPHSFSIVPRAERGRTWGDWFGELFGAGAADPKTPFEEAFLVTASDGSGRLISSRLRALCLRFPKYAVQYHGGILVLLRPGHQATPSSLDKLVSHLAELRNEIYFAELG